MLSIRGIDMVYKFKSGTKEVQGISFSKGEYKFKGLEIDRSLSFGRLIQAIEQNVSKEKSEQAKEQQSRIEHIAQDQVTKFFKNGIITMFV